MPSVRSTDRFQSASADTPSSVRKFHTEKIKNPSNAAPPPDGAPPEILASAAKGLSRSGLGNELPIFLEFFIAILTDGGGRLSSQPWLQTF